MTGVYGFAQRAVFVFCTLLLTTGALRAQESPADDPQATTHLGIPQDWSTQRVIYTQNGSVEDMMKVRHDPRFLTSFLVHNKREHPNQIWRAAFGERNQAGLDAGAPDQQLGTMGSQGLRFHPPLRRNKHSKIDWAVSMGTFGMAIGESPAMYISNADGTPSCTGSSASSTVGDFTVYSLKAVPSVGTQANLVGLTNLYSGTSPTGLCGTAPTFLFSYAIGSGRSYLSPVLSLDGKEVAWVEDNSANHAILHVTTWVAKQGTDATAGSVAIGNCSSGASCDVAIDYTSATHPGCPTTASVNTNSEIYVDYPTDTAFVGADNGNLYHLKSIFKSAPTFDFCITVNTTAGTALSGGVYDTQLSPAEFFIADSKKLYAYTVGATSFSLKATYTYGAGTLTGPGPVLDAFNNFIYVFSAQDLAGHTSVTQLPTTLATAAVVNLGPTNTNAYPILFYGAYDNSYFKNGPKSAASTLYSCGTDPTNTASQDLYAINFNAGTGVMNTAPVMSANTTVNPGGKNGICSPITEFYDGTTDRIFVGMGDHNATTGANVVSMYDVTTQLTNPTTAPKAQATKYLGGSSGLIVDNNASLTPQAESVYFTTLATSGTSTTCGANNFCAVKLTQSLLK